MLREARFVFFLALVLLFSAFTAGSEITEDQLLFDVNQLPNQNFGAPVVIDETPELGTLKLFRYSEGTWTVEDNDGVAYAYNVVPEPGSAVLALAALGTLLVITRRSR